jgi:hypothetical protein
MRRDPTTGAPDFFSFARDYLHAYMPKTRGLSPKTIEAYRISLECFLGYLADNEHIERDRVSFDHFDRQHLKGWLTWMTDQRHYAPKTVTLRLSAVKRSWRTRPTKTSPSSRSASQRKPSKPGPPEDAHRIPHRTRNTGDPRRVHRTDDEFPQEPDAAHPAV